MRRYVALRRRKLGLGGRVVFVPQSYQLGQEAQVDWSLVVGNTSDFQRRLARFRYESCPHTQPGSRAPSSSPRAALEKQTGCPAQLMIAQWAIESEWGAKPVGHAGYFGIKRAARHTKFCVVTTHEEFTPSQLGAWNHQHP